MNKKPQISVEVEEGISHEGEHKSPEKDESVSKVDEENYPDDTVVIMGNGKDNQRV
jgi:hypothetical protein